MTSRNLISAIFISVHLAVILVLFYVFFPLLVDTFWVILSAGILFYGPETNGISVVVGGVSEWVVRILAVAPILFALVFILLQKRSRRD